MTTNIWVAGGKGPHQIVTSPDGIIWTSSESGEAAFTGGICRAVAHNGLLDSGGLWVAVGGGYNGTPYHKIAYSTDGVKWTGSTSGNALFVGGDCVTVAYGNGVWVAGGSSAQNSVAYSIDGVNWTGSTSGNTAIGECYTVAYGNGLWVAGGAGNNTIATSPNGIDWTGRQSVSGLTIGLGVAYGNALWVMVGGNNSSGAIATSPDGINWTASTSGYTLFSSVINCVTVAYGNGLWVVGAEGDGNYTTLVAYSSDGTSWTGSTSGTDVFGPSSRSPASSACETVAYGNGLWVAGGYGDYNAAYSSLGTSWTASTGEGSLGALFTGGYVGACKSVAFGKAYTSPPSVYQQFQSPTLNIFQTNFKGMGNVGDYL